MGLWHAFSASIEEHQNKTKHFDIAFTVCISACISMVCETKVRLAQKWRPTLKREVWYVDFTKLLSSDLNIFGRGSFRVSGFNYCAFDGDKSLQSINQFSNFAPIQICNVPYFWTEPFFFSVQVTSASEKKLLAAIYWMKTVLYIVIVMWAMCLSEPVCKEL